VLILGLETSCDETAAAVVRDGRFVLSNVIASQHELHAEYGGVVPEIASRAHVERMLPMVREAAREAGVSLREVEAVAVGHRPGLIGSLLVGVAAAKGLAWGLGVPIVGVDHVQAHVWSGMLEEAPRHRVIEASRERVAPGRADDSLSAIYPALALVVSGGHTAMFRCEDALRVTRLGTTIDDAVGEAYDKVAAILSLGHPGGAKVDALARSGDERAHAFPKSRLSAESLDFSFSGLKTAVLYAVRGYPGRDGSWPERPPLGEKERADIAASFQRAAVGAVMLKMERALGRLRAEGVEVRSVLVGGGVSANSRLRAELERFAAERRLRLVLPAMEFCMDNAAMIAGLAWHRLQAGERDDLSLAAEPTSAV
jgi:N6-L-threonylcarbamoyladenine synthase